MIDPKDSQLEALLRRHLSSELDAQMGRAGARFDQMIRMQQQFADASAAHTADRTAQPPRRLHVNRFMLGVVGAAIAAAIAGVMIFSPTARITPGNGQAQQFVTTLPSPTSAEPEPVTLADQTVPVQRDVAWRTVDRGTVFVGEEEQPMRRLVRQRVDNYRWTDPQNNFNVEYSVPNDEVMLVGMKSY